MGILMISQGQGGLTAIALESSHTQGEMADLEFIASARESRVGAAVRIVGFT